MNGRFVEEIYVEDERDEAVRSSRAMGLVVIVVIAALVLGGCIAFMLQR